MRLRSPAPSGVPFRKSDRHWLQLEGWQVAPLPATAGTSLAPRSRQAGGGQGEPVLTGGILITASSPPGQKTPPPSWALGSIVEALTTVPGVWAHGPTFQNHAAPTGHTASRGSLLEMQVLGPHTPLIKLKSPEGSPKCVVRSLPMILSTLSMKSTSLKNRG